MKVDYFTRFAEQLLAAHTEDPDVINWDEVAGWLMDAPQHAPNAAMRIWTEMVCLALGEKIMLVPNTAEVAIGLGGYLDRLATLARNSLADVVVLPAFESSMRLLAPGTVGVHPLLDELFDTGWRPAKLMQKFEDHHAAIATRHQWHKGYSVPLEDTGVGGFFSAVYPLFLSSPWAVEPNPIYAKLFETYVVTNDAECVKYDCQFIRNVVSAAPGELGKALWFMRRQEWATPAHLEALFPLPLTKENVLYALDALVSLVADEPKGIVGKTMPLLQRHHPDVAALLSLHFSIFPDASAKASYAEVLVEPFLALLCPSTEQVHGAVELFVFEPGA